MIGFNLQSEVFLSNYEIDIIKIYSVCLFNFNYFFEIRFNTLRIIKKIYNILGQEIQTLVNRFEIAGTKSVIWNGKNSTGKSVSSGLYFYQFQAGDIIKNRKMILMK